MTRTLFTYFDANRCSSKSCPTSISLLSCTGRARILNIERLIYQFEVRKGVMVRSKSSEGSFSVARLTPEQAGQASKIISEEPAPRDQGGQQPTNPI
jgi:hypothetical protein